MTRLMNDTQSLILHWRIAGRSDEVSLAALGLSASASDSQIKAALATHLDCTPQTIAEHVVVRHAHAIVLRPEAIYG